MDAKGVLESKCPWSFFCHAEIDSSLNICGSLCIRVFLIISMAGFNVFSLFPQSTKMKILGLIGPETRLVFQVLPPDQDSASRK